MSARLPAVVDETAAALCDVMEQMLGEWQSRPFSDAAASDALKSAWGELARFRDAGLATADPLAPLERALASVAATISAATRATLGEVETLHELIVELTELRKKALDRAVEMSPGAAPVAERTDGMLSSLTAFAASVGVPQLRHGVRIPPLSLIREERRIEDELEEAKRHTIDDPEDTEDAPEAALLPIAAPAASTVTTADSGLAHDQLRALARELMEDLGMLHTLRRPMPNEPWIDAERFENRLLAQIDALFSLTIRGAQEDPVLALVEELYAYATEWAVPDPSRAFALAMPLACIDGEAAVSWLMVALRHAHQRTHEAFIDALVLGTNPKIPAAVASKLASESPAVLASLFEVCRRRRDVSGAVLAIGLGHADEAVVTAAIRALGTADPKVSTPLLSHALGFDGPPAVAAAEALARLGDEDGFRRLRVWLEAFVVSPSEDASLRARAFTALRALACRGRVEDEPLVRAAALELEGGLRLLGTFGHPPHVEILDRFMNDPAKCHAARRGLSVLLGGDFETQVATLDKDPEFLATLEKDRKERRERALQERGRIRKGAPHKGVATLVADLADPASRCSEREDAAFELAMLQQAPLPLDTADWISRQRAGLAILAG